MRSCRRCCSTSVPGPRPPPPPPPPSRATTLVPAAAAPAAPPQRADPFAVAETVGTGMLALGAIFLLRVLYLGARALGRTADAGAAEPSPRARAAEAVRGGHAGVPPPRAKKKGRARYAPCPPERDAEIEVAASEAGGERAPPEREPFTDL